MWGALIGGGLSLLGGGNDAYKQKQERQNQEEAAALTRARQDAQLRRERRQKLGQIRNKAGAQGVYNSTLLTGAIEDTKTQYEEAIKYNADMAAIETDTPKGLIHSALDKDRGLLDILDPAGGGFVDAFRAMGSGDTSKEGIHAMLDPIGHGIGKAVKKIFGGIF